MNSAQRSNGQITAKKIWSILRVIFMMVKKGISKSKLILDLNMIFKTCNHLANKAINGLIINHQSLIFRPNRPNNDQYEFSCTNSPTVGPIHQYLTMALAQHKKPNRRGVGYQLEDPTTLEAVHRVLEMINTHEGPTTSPSPPFVGFESKSPFVRQLRITDSPFPLKGGKGDNGEEEEEDVKVNRAAEDFIQRFYKNLKMQKSLESPCHTWAN